MAGLDSLGYCQVEIAMKQYVPTHWRSLARYQEAEAWAGWNTGADQITTPARPAMAPASAQSVAATVDTSPGAWMRWSSARRMLARVSVRSATARDVWSATILHRR